MDIENNAVSNAQKKLLQVIAQLRRSGETMVVKPMQVQGVTFI